ncbi:sperm-specific sodium:proton exchanger-like [Lineus longissimus]|uniref:sperm-specific sodium:proton exchanger-like n=1 Tax=Lineus longissimus TaxID=88925 RepID=UPI00315CCB6B
MAPYHTILLDGTPSRFGRSAADPPTCGGNTGQACVPVTTDASGNTHVGDWTTHDPTVILFISGSLLFGALTRSLLRRFHLPIPYTVVMLLIGICIGLLAEYTPGGYIRAFTGMARGDPHIILYVFLPILIFESAFLMDFHTLVKSILQITLLAVPGLLLSTFLTCLVPMFIFQYDWGWDVGMMFGAILSATDPVAVVALLHDLGASKQLATLIEGESLLNDGAAIVLFYVCLNLVFSLHFLGGEITLYFLQYACCSPLFGFISGKICTLWLSKIFNDALTEITITLGFTYSTYFICESLFNWSGVLAVVVLGLVINAERTVISPEVEAFLHRFWEMLAYIANTLIFVLVGVVIVEQALPVITLEDILFVLALYCQITVIRGLVIAVFSPILRKIGYGLTWKMGVVMTWGGLRGAVSLTLALLVAHDFALDSGNIGSKILIHTACIVMLTLVVNATTTQYLLKALGMSEISAPKRMAMASAIRTLQEVKLRSMNVLKNDRFLADSDWTIVDEGTTVKDPYKTNDEEAEMETLTYLHRFSKCPECSHDVQSEPSVKEKEEMEEEARLRLLKAQKISYWKQFEHGLLSQEAVRKLIDQTETVADTPGTFINVEELKQTWQVRGIYHKLKTRLERWIQTGSMFVIPPPKNRHLMRAYRIVEHMGFEILIYVIIMVNLAPIIAEQVIETYYQNDPNFPAYTLMFQIINIVFFFIYIVEAVLKMLGQRKWYWKSFWNYLDLAIIIINLVDVVIDISSMLDADLITSTALISPSFIKITKVFKFLRMGRALRLFKAVIPQILGFLNRRINEQLSFGYDVGKGYVFGEEEVRKHIDLMVDDKGIAKNLKTIIDTGRLNVVRELGMLQRQNPGIAVSVKTRQAIRNVLNTMRDNLTQLKGDGLLDETEARKLEANLEAKMKQIQNLPSCIPPPPPEKILNSISWIEDDQKVIEYMQLGARLMTFDYGDDIIKKGDVPNGIYIIISGMVKVYSEESDKDEEYVDFLTAGNVIGEMGILTSNPRNCTITCETSTQCYHIRPDVIIKAMEQFSHLEDRLWLVCAVRLASAILMKQPKYQGWTLDKIKMVLETAYLANLKDKLAFTYEWYMNDVILINGICLNANTREAYQGPCYIKSTINKLLLAAEESPKHVILIVPNDDPGQAAKHSSGRHLNSMICTGHGSPTGSSHDLEGANASSLCLRHASQHRVALKHKISEDKLKKNMNKDSAPDPLPPHLQRLRVDKPRPSLPQLTSSGTAAAAVDLHSATSQGTAVNTHKVVVKSRGEMAKSSGPTKTDDKDKKAAPSSKETKTLSLSKHLPPLQAPTKPAKEFPEDDMPVTVNV